MNISQSEKVLQKLRGRIVRGEFMPGSRLPSFGQLESQLQAGRTVVQQAIVALKQEGFVTSLPRKGLYITENPPHLGRYALVFPCLPGHRQWSRFHAAMCCEAKRLAQENPSIHFVHYEGVNDERRGGEVVASLLEQVQVHRLAGVILLPETHDLAENQHVVDSRIPLIIVDGEKGQTRRPQICTDIPMMFERSMGWFKEHKRKRIAMVFMADTFTWLTEKHFAHCDTAYRKAWVQRIGRSHPQTVDAVIELLMDYPAGKRPDGLFIADDNLVEVSLAVLVKLGLQLGRDLDVITHCNWPLPANSALPVQRIGFHAGQLLQTCLQVLEHLRQNGEDDRVLTMPALFESEVEQGDWQQCVIV